MDAINQKKNWKLHEKGQTHEADLKGLLIIFSWKNW